MKQFIPKLTQLPVRFYAIVIFLLGLFILNSPNRLVYDERDHVPGVEMLREYGISTNFLYNIPHAAGPLYELVHYSVSPITKLRIKNMRVFNFILLLSMIFLLREILATLKYDHSLFSSLNILSLPLTIVLSGLALSEIPAIFFMTAGLYLMVIGIVSHPSHTMRKTLSYAMSGLCFGLAILGRQPYLAVVAGMFYLIIQLKKERKGLALCLLVSLVTSMPLFIWWGGLVAPPLQSDFTSISLAAGLRVCGYAGIFAFILNPDWYRGRFSLFVVVLIFVTIGSHLLNWDNSMPLYAYFEQFENMEYGQFLAALFTKIFYTLGAFFLICLLLAINFHKDSPILSFVKITTFLIAIGTVTMTSNPSSRYVGTIIPLLAIIVGDGRCGSVIQYLGSAVGFLSLAAYYWKVS